MITPLSLRSLFHGDLPTRPFRRPHVFPDANTRRQVSGQGSRDPCCAIGLPRPPQQRRELRSCRGSMKTRFIKIKIKKKAVGENSLDQQLPAGADGIAGVGARPSLLAVPYSLYTKSLLPDTTPTPSKLDVSLPLFALMPTIACTCHTRTHAHARAHTHMHAYTCVYVYIYIYIYM